MSDLLCIGDIMLDVITVLSGEINFGGDTPARISTHGGGAAANVASWAALSQVKSHLVARVGRDSAGQTLLAELKALEVNSLISINSDEQTGVVVILVDTDGERTMFPDTAANSGLTMKDLPALDHFGAVYISGYALLNEKSRPGVLEMIKLIRSRGLPIFFDPTTVGGMSQVKLAQIQTWLPLMNTLLMNEEEAQFITKESNEKKALAHLLEMAPNAVIKLGACGAIGQSRGHQVISIPAHPAKVKDTTGAGDAFAGGFIAEWMKTPDMKTALLAGALRAAQCVAIVGARPQVTPAL